MTKPQASVLTDEVSFVTGAQAIKPSRQPFGRNTFYQLVCETDQATFCLCWCAAGQFREEEIDALFKPSSA